MAARIARRYAIAAVSCLVFAVIYAQFSHGVHSMFMTWMFVIPLVCGCVAALVQQALGHQCDLRLPRQLWGLCAATLTVASCLRGIFEIAGTGSPWLFSYVVVGMCFALASVVCTAFAIRKAG